MDRTVFEKIVNETIESLPSQFHDAIAQTAIVIEDRTLSHSRTGTRGGGMLLGLYEGIPITEWGRDFISGKLPDKITLFKENIEAYAETPEEIPHVIRETLLHEIAHHFGFDHDTIHLMEKRWRKARTRS
jgi:predicted Zn-dependent protease with MMP-like domain